MILPLRNWNLRSISVIGAKFLSDNENLFNVLEKIKTYICNSNQIKIATVINVTSGGFFIIISRVEQAIENARLIIYVLHHDDRTIAFLKLPIRKSAKL